MYEIDPRRLDLAREFRAHPFGLHSPELQAVLDRMRGLPIEGKHCLIVVKPREQWLLARMEGSPLMPVPVPGVVFNDPEEAEWTVFKIRWRELTGHDLAAAFGESELPASRGPAPAAPDPSRGIFAYPDQISVAPGERIEFKTSCLGIEEYRADIVRLIAPPTGPKDEGFREEEITTSASGTYRGRCQPLHLGSYVRTPAPPALTSFTMQLYAWPTLLAAGAQALMGSWSDATRRGALLLIDARGRLALRLGDGARIAEFHGDIPLAERRWHLLTATYDAVSGAIALHQAPISDRTFPPLAAAETRHKSDVAPAMGGAPLLIAAWQGSAGATGHFNGKLEAPRLAARSLSRDVFDKLARDPLGLNLGDDLVGAWDFSREIMTDDIVDLSPRKAHGAIVNLPARAVTGHNWTGAEMDFKHAPEQYGAIHCHDDDIDDARWETDVALTIPETMRSGVYALRLRGGEFETYCPFFVRPPKGKTKARVAYLAPTATYTVYDNNRARFRGAGTELIRGQLLDFDLIDLQLLHHGLGLSTYCVHSDGSGVCYGVRRRPVTNFRPKGRLWNFSSDLFIVDWLERAAEGYDVITDDDLHREGVDLLKPYQAIVTGSHPEYLSLEMLNAVESYLRGGGRMMYMGGNGFYWRVAYRNDGSGTIEVRRAEDGTRAWNAAPGEYYMGFTGEYGGLWSRQGRPPNMIAGVGFIAQGFDASSYYRRRAESRDPRVAFMFEGVTDEIIGDFGHLGGGAAGDEIDACDPLQGSPPHALVVASSEKHSNAFQMANDAILVPNGVTNALHSPLIRSDMTFFECPNGGAVFSTGSIAYAGSLAHNGYQNPIARLTGNVLRRFLDPEPFPMPPPGGG